MLQIKFTDTTYGKVSVTVSGNCYTWVNYNTEDAKYSLISGLYTNTYVPVLESKKVGNDTWYKVPVNLTGNDNVYGYTLASAPGVSITTDKAVVTNQKPTITATDKTIDEGANFDPKANVSAQDPEDGNLTNKIEITENTVNTKVPGTYKVTYKVTDSKGESVTKTITITVKENKAPVIEAKDVELTVGDEFKVTDNVKATDSEDGDITKNIKVTTNTVDTTKSGIYKVVYEVSDSKGKKTTKEIKVTVKDKEVIEEPKEEVKEDTKDEEINVDDIDIDELLTHQGDGDFYLESLDWDKTKKQFTISGYLTILNKNNTNKEYVLILVNKDTEEAYTIDIDKWTKDTPYDLGTENGYSYTESWFKGNIDFKDVPNGDYDLYMLAATDDSFAIELVDNFFNQDISRRGEDDKHGYNFKVLSNLKTQAIELNIRDELYTTSEAPTYRNMINEFEEIKFNNNKLYIQGYSYNYNGLYNNQLSITRKVIIENNKTYKQEIFDVASTKGPYTLTTKDNKDKTYAWYEKELDISKLEKGTYSIMVYTKTSNAEDFGELSDMFESIKETATINNKKYTVTYNKDKQDRIEVTVE